MQPINRIMIYNWDVFTCQLVWIYCWSEFCMGTADDPFLRFFATMNGKDQVLGHIFGGTFSNSFRQNLSLYPHCQDILQSTSCQIWDFLSSCWGCLLILCLEIYVPNDKFVFWGHICKVKLPTKFCLNSFEWFCLQISKYSKVGDHSRG